MTNEERDLIIQFIGRTGGRPATSGFAAGSVPPAGGPELPPVDPQADALIGELFVRYPEARYRLTQLAFIQEHALASASSQIAQLKQQIQQMQQPQQAAPAQGSPWGQPAQAQLQSRGLFSGLFGGGQPAPQPQYAPAPPPQYAPQYAPGYQPGMFQQGGNGFLGSALRTATGVAGGMLAAEAITSMFEGGHRGLGSEAGFGGGFGQSSGSGTVIENNTFVQGGSPWAAAPDPYDQGGAAKDSAWSNAAPTDSGWQDASSGGDSGWTDSGGGGDFDNT